MNPFSLETVLSYRERLEDIAKNELGAARSSEEKVKTALERQKNEYAELVLLIEKVQHQGVDINELIFHEGHLTFVKKAIATLEEELVEKRKAVEKSRQHLLEKSRDRQVMEKLKERQDDAWKQHLNKKEAAILDEIAIAFHERK